VAQSCTTQMHVEPGQNLLTIKFKGYDLPSFPVGQARVSQVSMDMDSQWEEVEEVLIGGTLKVRVKGEPGDKGVFYRITEGPTSQRVFRTRLWITTGIYRKDLSVDDLTMLQNKVNAAQFGGFPAKTLLLVGVKLPRVSLLADDDDVVPLIYDLLYSKKPWVTTGKVTKFVKYQTYAPDVKDMGSDGTPTNYYKLDSSTPNEPTVYLSEARHSSVTKVEAKVPDLAFTYDYVTEDSTTFNYLAGLMAW
jgi:hypothetical protein